jgi:hypothetical protein
VLLPFFYDALFAGYLMAGRIDGQTERQTDVHFIYIVVNTPVAGKRLRDKQI